MMDRTPSRLHTCGTTPQGIRRLAPLLALLVIMTWSAGTCLHAQAPPPPVNPPAPTTPPPPAPAAPAPQTPTSGGQAVSPPQATAPDQPPLVNVAAPAQRFQFKIDPQTPLKDLLPPPPKIKKIAGPVLGDDLTRVPEIHFQAAAKAAPSAEAMKQIARRLHDRVSRVARHDPSDEAMKQIAHQVAKINHLNDKKTDGFIEALRDERLDLHGLPFAMGDACRTTGERSRQFARAVATVRRALPPAQTVGIVSGPGPAPVSVPVSVPVSSGTAPTPTSGSSAGTPTPPPAPVVAPVFIAQQAPVDPPTADVFWGQYPKLCIQEDREQGKIRREQCETITLARIAALMQILAPMPDMHPGLVKYLSTVSHVEATRALAKMAIFSGEEEVRKAALDALKVRRERDYTAILVEGLRYPWPAVARRAAEAIAKLERKDLLPKLVDLLEEPDPRAPVTREVNQKRVSMVRELVRVNHHRSCLLCHAPGNTGKVSADTLTAEVPVPGQPLTPPSGGYNASQQDILVRLDVTYLRQDFSALQPVADANPWPEMQRFDFLVRSRELTDEEAQAYREKLTPHEPGEFSLYQRAALVALRELSGRDTEPTPEAWRRLLKISAESQHKTETP